jgi:hypothetical protein
MQQNGSLDERGEVLQGKNMLSLAVYGEISQ